VKPKAFAAVSGFAVLLALAVVMLGAYVRLSDAGLGCPDWPGCYGRIGAPSSEQAVAEANAVFPHRPVDSAIHLTHRIGALVLFIYLGALALAVMARAGAAVQRRLGLALLAALALQEGLGVANVLGQLPLGVAVAYNGGAALLLLSLLTLLHVLSPPVALTIAGRRTVPKIRAPVGGSA
jgi:cytochrome c oxidase assembly protein subunit 15